MADIPRITSDRLILRPHDAGDLDACLAMWSDERVVRFIGGKPADLAETWARMLRYRGLWQLLGYGYWLVAERQTGAFVGEVGFADFKRGLGADDLHLPEAGWAISPDQAGRGYASEAAETAHRWFDTTHGGGSFCMISDGNAASVRVAEKLGYGFSHTLSYKGEPTGIFLRRGAPAT